MTYSDSEIQNAVLNAAKQFGDDITVSQYLDWASERDNVPVLNTIYRRFGGWNALKKRLGLKTNEANQYKPPSFTDNPRGYEVFMHNDGKRVRNVSHSRLLATLLVDDISELKDSHVHHKSRIPWLNTEENIEVLSPSKHIKRHHEEDIARVTLQGETDEVSLTEADTRNN